MKNNNRNLLRILFYGLGITIALAFTAYLLLDVIIDFLWFKSLKYAMYFAMREGYRDGITVKVTLLFAALFYVNFIIARTNLNASIPAGDNDNFLTRLLKSRSIKFFIPLSFLLTIPILIPVYSNWENILLYYFSSPSGITDPAYGRDISFYLFSYPVFLLLQQELLASFSLLCIILVFFYGYGFGIHKINDAKLSLSAKTHLTVLVIIVIMLQGWGIVIERISLLYEDRHMPVFFGPGAVEMGFDLPLIWLTFFAFLGATLSAIYFIYKQRGLKLIAGFSIAYLVLLGIRQLSFIPDLIDNFYVKPNPLKAERRYIKNHIDATVNAFGLNQVKQIDYPAASSLSANDSAKISRTFYNVPLWESRLLADVYEQLQAIRTFYSFSSIATDRYLLDDKNYQVNIGARELFLDKLPSGANNWKNRHLIFTHGYGVAITPSAQQPTKQTKWFLRDISQNAAHEKLKITDPEIYYGLGNYEYAIVPNDAKNSSRNLQDMRPEYTGSGGLLFSSFLKRLAFSAHLGESNILFSNLIKNHSRLLFNRNISQRIHTIAPFLKQDPDPYPVVIKHKLYWVVDAYTTSDMYPLVARVKSTFPPEVEEKKSFNYIRNSVKIIVDAYNGSVDFYIVDKTDPVINTYNKAYPTLFKDIKSIPKEFITHLSYPKTLFRLQMNIFARYHQDKPEIFFQQNERLQLAHNEAIMPFYLTFDPLEEKHQSFQQKFVLVETFSPYQRDNLAFVNIAGCILSDDCDNQYRADIVAYKLPIDVQIEGPVQVTGLIDQSPEISRQFTLWNQVGSKVIRGRMIIMPIEEHILYIQPIYLAASSKTGFPQLVRVIVSMNQLAVMDTTLKSAFEKLQQRLQKNRSTSARTQE